MTADEQAAAWRQLAVNNRLHAAALREAALNGVIPTEIASSVAVAVNALVERAARSERLADLADAETTPTTKEITA